MPKLYGQSIKKYVLTMIIKFIMQLRFAMPDRGMLDCLTDICNKTPSDLL